MVCCSDFAGQVRGKGFPASELPDRWTKGVGWTPTNIMINCFGEIPATPWGALGDLVLRPEREGETRFEIGDNGPAHHFILGAIENMDGSPWICCPRNYLTEGLARLRDEHGINLRVAFEHEFVCATITPRLGAAYGLDAIVALKELPEIFLGALRQAELEVDTFLPEYAPGQFEITVKPALGTIAADRAVKLRQIIRTVAHQLGHRVSFAPVMRKGTVGNGVHIHFSLEDVAGNPLSYDASSQTGISERAGHFVAGILAHGSALTALTAPSATSYERLKPNSWSASITNLGVRDREALVRVCPVSERPDADVSRSFNFEYRACDAAASPFLALGAIVRAGLAGLAGRISLPEPISTPRFFEITEAERRAKGLRRLPESLSAALDALEADQETLMSPEMQAAYVMHKRGEIARVNSVAFDELCAMYAQVY